MQASSEKTFARTYIETMEQYLNFYQRLQVLRTQYDAVQFPLTGDALDEFPGLTKDEFLAALTTMAAIEALMVAGHATNLYKLKR